ncbi:anthrone oxygenase family protein [Hymenobacter jeollabukensis]|nr:anthrone oxygenase family protein [Hymenobacter jeollabukensis]
MKRTLLFASLIVASGLLLTNIYTSLVDAPAWGHDIPRSIQTARDYYRVSNPGNFFRVFSPLNQGLALLCAALFWKRGRPTRHLLLLALLLYVGAEGMTFNYFYPRNAILFGPQVTDVATLQRIWQEWSAMNWVRTLVVAGGIVCSALALHRSYFPALAARGAERKGVAIGAA